MPAASRHELSAGDVTHNLVRNASLVTAALPPPTGIAPCPCVALFRPTTAEFVQQERGDKCSPPTVSAVKLCLSAGTSLCLLTLRGCFCSHKGSSGGCRETRWPTTLTTCLFPEVCRPLTWSCSQSHLLDPSSGSYGKGCVWNPSTTVDCLRFLGSTGFSLCVFRPELVGAYGFRWWYLPGEVLPFYLYKMLFFTHAVL